MKTSHKIALSFLIAALPLFIFFLLPTRPKWLIIAKKELGVTEGPGAANNERILEYHATTGGYSKDAVPWCSSFVNWVMQQAGYKPTGSAQAIKWADWGRKIDQPCKGCIAVWHWGSGKGHVGFVVGKRGSKLLVLGGNQSDQVKVSEYSTNKLIAYVVPEKYNIPKSDYL